MPRLDKILVQYQFGTRSELKKRIKKEGARINNTLVKNESANINEHDVIEFNGQQFVYHEFVYYMMNKQSNRICSHESHQATIYDDLDFIYPNDLFSVGRLDKDTTGLIILTNDGQYAHKITRKQNSIVKRYFVTLQEEIGVRAKQLLLDIDLGDDGVVRAKKVEEISPNEIIVSITDGKYHQVKRMIHSIDNEVIKLHRLSIGQLELDSNLEFGQTRILNQEEIEESLWEEN